MSDEKLVRVHLAAYRDEAHTELVGEGLIAVPAAISDDEIRKGYWQLIGVDPQDERRLFYVINRKPK